MLGLATLPFFTPQAKSFFAGSKAECLTPEEEAMELQRIMQSGPGEIPPDREEIMEMLAARMKNKRLPVFAQIMMPIKSFSNIQPNDGMRISFGLPMSQRF